MYGSHYSTAAGVVLHFLVRLQPFAAMHRQLQSGHFDVADRLFHSVPTAWKMCTSALHEVKELTPEWFSTPGFLTNVNDFDLGQTQDGKVIDDVEMPPWAAGPEHFVEMNRRALESEHVSAHLHEWIDLIFGYKQKGAAAVAANNVFFHLVSRAPCRCRRGVGAVANPPPHPPPPPPDLLRSRGRLEHR